MERRRNNQQHSNAVKLLSASELREEARHDKQIKAVYSRIPFEKFYQLADISLHVHGPQEDAVYAFNEHYRKNIRRGNTVIVYENEHGQFENFWGRKGLQKFFDLYREYVSVNLGEKKELTSFGIKDQAEHVCLHNVIFAEAETALRRGAEVQIWKLVKANGENCQVSYLFDLDAWVIASKNVSLVAKYVQDVEAYSGERYYFAQLMAREWFNVLARVEKHGGAKAIQDLKQELDGKTMVGEYCGNRKHQHLVKYEKIDIFFYALTLHNSERTCLSPDYAYDVFESFGLSSVQRIDVGLFNEWQSFNRALANIFDSTATADIETEQEGSVLYFVQRGEKMIDDQVLSLCKLKTLEYRIYRKLREKLRTFIQKRDGSKKQANEILRAFQREAADLCKDNKPARSLDYYQRVADLAFDFVLAYPQQNYLVHDEYITFLSIVIYCLENGQAVSPELFEEQQKKQLLEVPWSTYGQKNIQKSQGQYIQKKEVPTQQQTPNPSEIDGIPHTVGETKGQNKEQPAQHKDQPVQHKDQPAQHNQQPVQHNQQPAQHNQQPAQHKDQPAQHKEQPVQHNQQPIQHKDQPAQHKEQPVQHKEQPVQHNQQQPVQQKEVIAQKSSEQQQTEQSQVLQNKQKELPQPQHSQVLSARAKQLLVIVPISIPGMGKTTFREIFQRTMHKHFADRVAIFVLSSDELRRECMDHLHTKRPHLNEDELFSSSFKSFRQDWEFNIQEAVQRFPQEGRLNILFLDKNHPPNAIEQTVNQVQKYSVGQDVNVKIVAIVPAAERDTFSEQTKVPFPLHLLVQCIYRVQNRKTHPTLIGKGTESLKVLAFFIGLFKYNVLSDSIFQSAQINYVVRGQFCAPQKTQYSEGLQRALRAVIDDVKPNQDVKDFSLIEVLARELEREEKQNPKAFAGAVNDQELRQLSLKIIEEAEKQFGGFQFKHPQFCDPKDQQQAVASINKPLAAEKNSPKAEEVKVEATEQPEKLAPVTVQKQEIYVKVQSEQAEQQQQQQQQTAQQQETKTKQQQNTGKPKQRVVFRDQVEGDTQDSWPGRQEQKDQNRWQKRPETQGYDNQRPVQRRTQYKTSYSDLRRDPRREQVQYVRAGEEKEQEQRQEAQQYPLFLGAFVIKGKNTREVIEDYIQDNVDELYQIYGEDAAIKSFTLRNYKFPPTTHLTSLYLGDRLTPKILQSDYYTSFREGLELDLQVLALVIVDGLIIVGICKRPDEKVLKVQNEYPHITLMLGRWPARFSNNLLSGIFRIPEYRKIYEQGNFEIKNMRYVKRIQVEVDQARERTVTAYLVKPNFVLNLQSLTGSEKRLQ